MLGLRVLIGLRVTIDFVANNIQDPFPPAASVPSGSNGAAKIEEKSYEV